MKAANKYRKSSLECKVGDLVWLLTKNIHTKRPSNKLNHKRIGFYRVKRLVRSFYQLKLPTSIQIYDIFYFNLLKLAAEDLLPGQINDLPLFVVVNDKEKWEINDIFDAKKHGRYWMLFQVK